jgi:prepilin-type N-terminal cleavage/methylation domain-containing protein
LKILRRSGICLPRPQPGFTLVEMTIVLLIVSILLAGILIPLSIQIELRKYTDTKKTMDQINEAIMGFVLINGRLPCPATGTVADGTAGAGTELLTGEVCTSYTGVIPWTTLNVAEADEWGGRFTYRVSSAFADTFANTTWGCTPSVTPASPASFALCANGDMQVKSRTTSKVLYNVTSAALPAVFVSHGKNGYGAYLSNGTQIAPAPNTTDEYTNSLSTTTIFVTREKTDASSGCSDTSGSTSMCEFDDLVAFVPLTTLMNRMVISGKLP